MRFTGPLARELAYLGYTRTSATTQLQLAAHLSRPLEARGACGRDLTPEAIELFVADRRSSHANLRTQAALALLRRLGVVPPAPPPAVSADPAEILLAEFARYLGGRRGLTGPVITAYLHWARPFAREVLCTGGACRVAR